MIQKYNVYCMLHRRISQQKINFSSGLHDQVIDLDGVAEVDGNE